MNKREQSFNPEPRPNRSVEIKDFTGKKIELPVIKSTIEFPDHLKEETGGVRGYERVLVGWEEIDQIVSKNGLKELLRLASDLNLSIPDKLDQIGSLASFAKLGEFIESSVHRLSMPEVYERKDDAPGLQEAKDGLLDVKKFFSDLVNTLGDNFFERTNIHGMDLKWVTKSEQARQAFERNLITQRIFDPSLNYEKLIYYSKRSINQPAETHGTICYDPPFGEGDPVGKTTEQIKHELRSNNEFLICSSGLSVSNGGSWTGKEKLVDLNMMTKPFFGFDVQNNQILKDYTEKSVTLFEKIIRQREKDDFLNLPEYVNCLRDLLEKGKSSVFDPTDNPHPKIPIIIGYPELPDLRWCHASYAYIPTKNGINILTMNTQT